MVKGPPPLHSSLSLHFSAIVALFNASSASATKTINSTQLPNMEETAVPQQKPVAHVDTIPHRSLASLPILRIPDFRPDIDPHLVEATFLSPVVLSSNFHLPETSWSAPLPEYPFSIIDENQEFYPIESDSSYYALEFTPASIIMRAGVRCSLSAFEPNALFFDDVLRNISFAVKFCVPCMLFVKSFPTNVPSELKVWLKARPKTFSSIDLTFMCPCFQVLHRVVDGTSLLEPYPPSTVV